MWLVGRVELVFIDLGVCFFFFVGLIFEAFCFLLFLVGTERLVIWYG